MFRSQLLYKYLLFSLFTLGFELGFPLLLAATSLTSRRVALSLWHLVSIFPVSMFYITAWWFIILVLCLIVLFCLCSCVFGLLEVSCSWGWPWSPDPPASLPLLSASITGLYKILVSVSIAFPENWKTLGVTWSKLRLLSVLFWWYRLSSGVPFVWLWCFGWKQSPDAHRLQGLVLGW